MTLYAVIENGIVLNIIEAPSQEVAEEATGYICEAMESHNDFAVNDEVSPKRLKAIKAARETKAAEAQALEDAAEADRIKAIEAENERLRQAEADRLAAAEASKPKPVTGIFVRVEPN